jgi:hypothetical protein
MVSISVCGRQKLTVNSRFSSLLIYKLNIGQPRDHCQGVFSKNLVRVCHAINFGYYYSAKKCFVFLILRTVIWVTL